MVTDQAQAEPRGDHGARSQQPQLDVVIAGADKLEAICSLPLAEQAPLDAACLGVLAETALTGRQRYEWRLLVPLLHSLIDSVLASYTRQDDEVGPPRPLPLGFDSAASVAVRLHSLLASHDQAPFTLQRLCEVLLEPRKQYSRLDKLVVAIEKLLMVTSTRLPDPADRLPPPPALASLRGVNDNPPSPYLDGRAPQVLDAQQQQALLQQHASAAAAAHQQHQHYGGQLCGLPNGVDDGPPPLGDLDGGDRPAPGPSRGALAAAAAEAMQLDVPHDTARPVISTADAASAAQFVESALAETSGAAAVGAAPGAHTFANGRPHPAGAGGEAAAFPAPSATSDQQKQQEDHHQQQHQQQQAPLPAVPSRAFYADPQGRSRLAGNASGAPTSMDVDASQVQRGGGQQLPQQQHSEEIHPLDRSSAGSTAEAAQQVIVGLAVPEPAMPAAASNGLDHLIGRLQQLPQALQTMLLPPLLHQQQQQHNAAAIEAGSAAHAQPVESFTEDDAAALYRLLASLLPQLPPDQALHVLNQLQLSLPQQFIQQLQQQLHQRQQAHP